MVAGPRGLRSRSRSRVRRSPRGLPCSGRASISFPKTHIFPSTGCLRVREKFQAYHISAIDEPILKSFDVVRVNTGRFDLVHSNH